MQRASQMIGRQSPPASRRRAAEGGSGDREAFGRDSNQLPIHEGMDRLRVTGREPLLKVRGLI